MYLQILLPERDTHVHRFLWRSLEIHKQPPVYVLSRVTFGDKPSLDMASYLMLWTAKENEGEFSDASAVKPRSLDDPLLFYRLGGSESDDSIRGSSSKGKFQD